LAKKFGVSNSRSHEHRPAKSFFLLRDNLSKVGHGSGSSLLEGTISPIIMIVFSMFTGTGTFLDKTKS